MSNKKLTRRQVLKVVSGGVLLPAVSSHIFKGANATDVFKHGVASGDPDQSSLVIWTRVSQSEVPVDVEWTIATDPDFTNHLQRGNFRTDSNRDYTVKVLVSSLEAGQEFFYKFRAMGTLSPIGRSKTLPKGHLDKLVLAVVSCANYSFGYFNGYDAIAKDPAIDMVVHLGDYIYEHGPNAYGGATGKRIGRNHLPPHEIITLTDYRQRHAQYKTDHGSLAMHARHPLIVIWDDHDTANNSWVGGASNHQSDEGSWLERSTAALQAYYEWLPIRDPLAVVDQKNYWRHYKFGDLVSLITLESRLTGRSQQISYDKNLPLLKTTEQAQNFYQTVIANSNRNMLSKPMEKFLSSELEESVESERSWRIIGNQTIIAKSKEPMLNDSYFSELRKQLSGSNLKMLEEHIHIGNLNLPIDLDIWDGYPAARERFYQLAKDNGVKDLLVISGDSHSFWVNELYDNKGDSMGVELGSTGLTSPRSIMSLGEKAMKYYDDINTKNNKEIVWSDGRHRGFIKLEINHQMIHADFISVSTVESKNYKTKVVHSVDIINSNGLLKYI